MVGAAEGFPTPVSRMMAAVTHLIRERVARKEGRESEDRRSRTRPQSHSAGNAPHFRKGPIRSSGMAERRARSHPLNPPQLPQSMPAAADLSQSAGYASAARAPCLVTRVPPAISSNAEQDGPP